jgi:hypothetical protein
MCNRNRVLAAGLAVLILAGTGWPAELVNLAPLGSVTDSARTDGARSGVNVNDEDERTYWSAWPYTMRGGDQDITLEVVLPFTARVHRAELQGGNRAGRLRLDIWQGSAWHAVGDEKLDQADAVFVPAEPIETDRLRLVYPDVRTGGGAVIHELLIMGEMPANVERGAALSQEDTPDLDWSPITQGVETSESPGGPANKWYERRLDPPRLFQRVEMRWQGADYARRTLLEIERADGTRVLIPRHRFSTSFTLPEPVTARRIRLWCTQVGKEVRLSELRLCGPGSTPVPPEDPQVRCWAETSLIKVDRHARGPAEQSPFAVGDPLQIELARNEYEAGLVIVLNDSSVVLRQVQLAVGELRSDSGATIPADHVVVNPIAWVNGEYADVLLPPGSFRVAPGEVRPVWITVHAGADQPAGVYRGEVTCTCAGREVARVPVEVIVWDVTLPGHTHFQTHYFTIWGTKHYLRDTLDDPVQREALLTRVADQFIRHRISPGDPFIMEDYEKHMAATASWSAYLEEFDRWSQKLIDGGLPFVGVLPGPHAGMEGGPDSEADYWRAMEQHLADRGWLDRFAVRVGDEPPPGNQKVTDRCEQIRAWAPRLLRQCAFSSFGIEGTRSWIGLVNAFGINCRTYGRQMFEDVVGFSLERQFVGDNVSWYIHPVLSIEETTYLPRAFLWLLHRHRINGALLYGVAEWAHREVDRWEDDFVIHGKGFNSWGVLLWPEQGGMLDSVRFEAVRDGIEDFELRTLLRQTLAEVAGRMPGSPKVDEARRLLDDTDALIVALNADQADRAQAYRIQDRHADSPILCTNAIPADLLDARRRIAETIVELKAMGPADSPVPAVGQVPETVPQWARQYTDGLRAWRDIIYYWLDRQKPDGTFGFGWGEDCEMIVGWPGVMMAADDRRIEQAIERLADNRWFNPNIQQGYIAKATDPEHGPEPISYTNPVLLFQRFGSPKLIERLMVTAKNVEHWTARTPKGDLHMRSTYFGSQQMYDWLFYREDSPINARAWIPMMHLVLYNRDPYLMDYYLGWMDAWATAAMSECYGKPPGILPGSIAVKTGEPGAYTKNWWGAGAHDFSSLWYQTRLHGMLVVAYTLTGEERYITPLREMLRFFSTYGRPPAAEGEPLPPDRLPERYTFPEGWRDGTLSTRWARDVAFGHPGNWYYYVTGDTQFDEAFGKLFDKPVPRGPFERIDMNIVAAGYRRALGFRDSYFEKIVPQLKYGGSTANYAAAWWQKQYGSMTFGQRCFRDGGKLTNSVNWPWVDFPPPSVVWKDTGYDTGIFVLEDAPQELRVGLCNVADVSRTIGAQLFTLDEGTYHLRLGPDADEDGTFDAVTATDIVEIERGTIVRFELLPRVTMILELVRDPDAGSLPAWQPRPDLGLDPWDIMISSERPVAGDEITITIRAHNIGTEPAAEVAIQLLGERADGQRVELGSARIDRIDAPQKLVPSMTDATIRWTVSADIVRIGAQLDPSDVIDELYEGNNMAWIALAEARSTQPVKESRRVPPASRPSLKDVTRTDLSRYDVPFRAGITVDGEIGSSEWHDVPVFDLIPHAENRPLAKATQMRVAYDDEALYLALDCEEPDPGMLDTDLSRIDDIYYNDGFEIFLDPGAQVWRYWQFVFDTVPHQFQTLARNRYARQAPWDVAVNVGDDRYMAEVRFPFSSFDVDPPKPGSRWRMNVMRYTTTLPHPDDPQRRTSERSHFSPQGKLHLHHTPELFGDLYFLPPSE